MSYRRVYPTKNNTIFKYNAGDQILRDGFVNTGTSPIMQLMSGNGQSTLLFGFDITALLPVLNNYSFTCNLKLFDAGTVFEPALPEQNIDLLYFPENFIEGNGYAFTADKAVNGISNYSFRDSTNHWPSYTTVSPAQHLNNANQDLIFDVSSFIATALSGSINIPNFGIRITQNVLSDSTYTKFIYSRFTRTIFQPYLEFTINDSVLDNRQNATANKVNNFYLLNDNGYNFSDVVTCNIKSTTGTLIIAPTVNNPFPGVYYVSFTPALTLGNKAIIEEWSIGGVVKHKRAIQIEVADSIFQQPSNKYAGLYFYPTPSYAFQAIRRNDVVQYIIISQIRGKGDVIFDSFEYRVVASNGFEMIPWTRANVYNDRIYFNIYTDFFYPELEYEVFTRVKLTDIVITSNNIHKFRLKEDGPNNLEGLNASPYNNRDFTIK
jgi:hypothetical protein